MKLPNEMVFSFLLLSCFGSFTWAFKKFFRHPDSGTKPLLSLIKYGGLVAMLTHSIAMLSLPLSQNVLGLGTGVLLLLLSLGLFWSAIQANRKEPLLIAFANSKPGHLVGWGPYQWVRHPFYLSYSLCWLASPLALGNFWIVVPGLVLMATYWVAAREEEQAFLESNLREQYQAYRERTGMFFPKLF